MNPTIAKLNALALCRQEVERLSKMLFTRLDNRLLEVFYREWAVYVFFKGAKFGLSVTCPTSMNMDSWRYGFVITTTFITQNDVVPSKFGRKFGYENAREWHSIEEIVGECNRLLSLVPLV